MGSKPFDRVIGEPPKPSEGGHDETINETIDASVFERWQMNASYRPKNLADWAQRHGCVDLATLTGSVLAHAPQMTVA